MGTQQDTTINASALQCCVVLTVPQIRTIDRVCEIPHEGPFCDLMWSDPEDIETWAVSPRGAGWLFGRKVTSEFNSINGEPAAAALSCSCISRCWTDGAQRGCCHWRFFQLISM